MLDGPNVPLLSEAQTTPGQHLHEHRMLAVHGYEMTLAILLDGLPLGGLIFREAVGPNVIDTQSKSNESKEEGKPQLGASCEGATILFSRSHSVQSP
jgi:hypothetical protein